MKKHTFKLSNWKKPTPLVFKRVGNSLLAASTFVAGYSFYNSHEYIGVIGLLIGIVGTVLTNFFTEE